MNRMSKRLALAAATAFAFAAGTVLAGESKVVVVPAASGADAFKVVVDPVTGRIRAATPEEIAAMGSATAMGGSATGRGAHAPTVVNLGRTETTMIQRPNGSATIRRSLDDLDSVVAERGADGKLKARHGGKDAAPQALSNNQPKE